MKPLVVVHSSPVWLPRTQTWMHEQCKNLPASVESHVVCERTENLDQFALPNIHALANLPRWRVAWDRVLRKLGARHHMGLLVDVARKHDAKVLHSHFGHVGWLDLDAARQAELAHVVTFYGQDVNMLPRTQPLWRERYMEMFARITRVLCEGPHMARCIAALGCPVEKILVHHLGVDLRRFEFRPRKWDRNGPLRVLLCATFTEKKGIPYAIAALGALSRVVPLEITLVGDANQGERQQAEKTKILSAIELHGLARVVTLPGYLPHAEILRLAYEHHVFVSPSVTAEDGDTEGGAPVAVCELAATGMPIVSTRHCDIPNVVEDGVGALLADERDTMGLLACLGRLVHDPQLWEELVTAARARIESHFDAAKQGTALAKIYESVASGAAPTEQIETFATLGSAPPKA